MLRIASLYVFKRNLNIIFLWKVGISELNTLSRKINFQTQEICKQISRASFIRKVMLLWLGPSYIFEIQVQLLIL